MSVENQNIDENLVSKCNFKTIQPDLAKSIKEQHELKHCKTIEKNCIAQSTQLYVIQNYNTKNLKHTETIEKVFKPNKEDIEQEKKDALQATENKN